MSMNRIFVFLWAIIIIIATCNNDAHAFLYDQIIRFSFNASPNLTDLFIIDDIDFTDSFYFLQKTGHFISFALLYVLLFNWLKKHFLSVIIAVSFAIITEILQLYFMRDGRLFDAFIDTVGIFLAFITINATISLKQRQTEDIS